MTVCHPDTTSIGGDLLELVRDADGTITSVNAIGPASANVDPVALRARYGDTLPVTWRDHRSTRHAPFRRPLRDVTLNAVHLLVAGAAALGTAAAAAAG